MPEKRNRFVVAVFGAALLTGGGAFADVAHEHHQHHGHGAVDHSQHKAAAENAQPAAAGTIELKLAEAKLIDQHGTALDFKADVVGRKIVVMDFVYTTCTTVCPVLSVLLAQVQDKLGRRAGSEVALVSMSVDPVRDTPARLKEHSARYQAGPGWTWLTGRTQAVESVLKSLGAYTPSFVDHPALVMVGDGQTGKWTRYYGFPDPDQIVAKVNELGAARARSASAHKEH
jgi:protein SCO1/2